MKKSYKKVKPNEYDKGEILISKDPIEKYQELLEGLTKKSGGDSNWDDNVFYLAKT
ncbi:1862_t:CDS:2 [Gigaspora margarita]|uniref:1862_t:CDS:1 n=1 Tax=Gigaspora margarita TaxID=4874 RepID=A0ABM8W0I5_GIGMA|nr:1862_t:CDS:2 [Gigaspora margarita]